jgi:hypothetical protein
MLSTVETDLGLRDMASDLSLAPVFLGALTEP